MIAATVRSQLTRADANLVISLLEHAGVASNAELEERLREGGFDALLDDPAVLSALMTMNLAMQASLSLFAYVVARHALLQTGEDDRELADYTASVLLHFGLRDRAWRVSEADDETYDTLVGLIGAVNGPDPRRNFLVRAHLGNYALWLAGLFPDYVEHRRWERGGPDLEYYDEMGTRGFRLAAEHRLASEHGMKPLLNRAADRFPIMRVALNRVSDALLFPSVSSPERIMRQVKDEARWKVA